MDCELILTGSVDSITSRLLLINEAHFSRNRKIDENIFINK